MYDLSTKRFDIVELFIGWILLFDPSEEVSIGYG